MFAKCNDSQYVHFSCLVGGGGGGGGEVLITAIFRVSEFFR